MLQDREKAFENKMAREEEYEFRLNAATVRNLLSKIGSLLPEAQSLEELSQYCLHYQEESLIKDILKIFEQNSLSISERELMHNLSTARDEAAQAMKAAEFSNPSTHNLK